MAGIQDAFRLAKVGLEHVALHEGLMLPSTPRHDDPAVAPHARRPKPSTSAGPRRRP